jgi:hypothetical protein
MDPGSDPVSDLDLASISIPLEPSSDLKLLPEYSSMTLMGSVAGLESLEDGVTMPPSSSVVGLEQLVVGDLGETSEQGRGGGSVVVKVGFGFVSAVWRLSQVSFPDFPLPWEDDLSVSPSNRDWEVSVSGVADPVDLPGSEETLAKGGSSQANFAWISSPAKSLIRCNFLGPRAAPTVLDDVLPAPASDLIRRGFLGSCSVPPTLPVVKGATSLSEGAADLGRSLSQPVSSKSSISKSQLGYFRRVKEKLPSS